MTEEARIGLIDEFAELAEYEFEWDSPKNKLCHEMMRAYFNAKQRADHLADQIKKLADFLLQDCGGPTRSESATEMAIRLLQEALEREVERAAQSLPHPAEERAGFEVFVVACRPYVEKVLGCETKEGLQADGMFFLDADSARQHCERANLVMRDAGQPPAFSVHRALLKLERGPVQFAEHHTRDAPTFFPDCRE